MEMRKNLIMLKPKFLQISLLAVLLWEAVGCGDLAGTRQQEGGATGAASGEVTGGERHRLQAALFGGALGETGGYVIGAEGDNIRSTNHTAAVQANNGALSQPATVQDVSNSNTADLNHDGFVTLDEVVALSAAELSDQEILRRLQATNQVFELTDEQRKYLRDHGVPQSIVDQISEINRSVRDQLLQSQAPSDAISGGPVQ
jgi:hypothetical protein